jgi:hypothetical protein
MPASQVFGKFKREQLRSGGPNGPVVKSRAQELAIYESEKRKEESTGSADTPKRNARPKRRKIA